MNFTLTEKGIWQSYTWPLPNPAPCLPPGSMDFYSATTESDSILIFKNVIHHQPQSWKSSLWALRGCWETGPSGRYLGDNTLVGWYLRSFICYIPTTDLIKFWPSGRTKPVWVRRWEQMSYTKRQLWYATLTLKDCAKWKTWLNDYMFLEERGGFCVVRRKSSEVEGGRGKGEPRIKKAWNQQGSEKRGCRGQRKRPEQVWSQTLRGGEGFGHILGEPQWMVPAGFVVRGGPQELRGGLKLWTKSHTQMCLSSHPRGGLGLQGGEEVNCWPLPSSQADSSLLGTVLVPGCVYCLNHLFSTCLLPHPVSSRRPGAVPSCLHLLGPLWGSHCRSAPILGSAALLSTQRASPVAPTP